MAKCNMIEEERGGVGERGGETEGEKGKGRGGEVCPNDPRVYHGVVPSKQRPDNGCLGIR